MDKKIPTSVLSIIEAKQQKGEKLTTLICRMTGSFKPFTKAVIFPGERSFQVKDITPLKDHQVSVKVKGIPFKECTPFSIITPEDLRVQYKKSAYFLPDNFHAKEFFPGDYYITGGVFTGYRMFKRDKYWAKVKKCGNFYRVDFPFKSPLVPGALYHFENTRGFKGDMKLIYPGFLDKRNENIISNRIDKFRSRPGVKAVYSIMLRTDGYTELPYYLGDESFEGARSIGHIRLMERESESIRVKILKQSKASGGVEYKTLQKNISTNYTLFTIILKDMIEAGEVYQYKNHIVYNGEDRVNLLSPLAKEAYRLIQDAGSNGYSIRTLKNRGLERCFSELERMHLVYDLDGDLFFLEEFYKELLQSLLSGKKVGDKLTIQDVRDKTDLSRRYIIDILNRLEDDGIIEREEDDDRVIKKIM